MGMNKPGQNWTGLLADPRQEPRRAAYRDLNLPTLRAPSTVPIANPGRIATVVDPDAGDALM